MIKDALPTHCDICVIGAGSGGLSVAAGAAQLGMRTVLIERDKMGGDCLNTGCVPSKSLLAAAKHMDASNHARTLGITGIQTDVDYDVVHQHIQDVIAAIKPHDSEERFEGLGVQVIKAHAHFIDDSCVQAGSHTVHARFFVIAAGSRPHIPPIKGLDPDKIFTNETIFSLQDVPRHLAIIGGGPIGLEMAYAYRHLGASVTVIAKGHIMPKDDPELVAKLRDKLTRDGITFEEQTNVTAITHGQGKHEISIQSKRRGAAARSITASHILVAAGRRPNVDGMDLARAGISYSDRGIETDQRLRTGKKHIFAIGDIIGGPQFTHIAGYHAGIVIRNICFRIPAKVNYAALPWVTYTNPELAHVGMSLPDAHEAYGLNGVDIHRFDLKDIDRARADNKPWGGISVIIRKKNKRILGASILSPAAAEMINIWGLAIQKKCRLQAIASLIVPYPSYSDLSKRVAGDYFSPLLFNSRTRRIVRWLQKLPLF